VQIRRRTRRTRSPRYGGYPDISAQSKNFPIALAGEVVGVDAQLQYAFQRCGIVQFTPCVIDRSRRHIPPERLSISKGKSPLGFLNPLIYSAAGIKGFNDIASGSNPGCGTSGFLACEGMGAGEYYFLTDWQSAAVLRALPRLQEPRRPRSRPHRQRQDRRMLHTTREKSPRRQKL
jgi:hypothetical protein